MHSWKLTDVVDEPDVVEVEVVVVETDVPPAPGRSGKLPAPARPPRRPPPESWGKGERFLIKRLRLAWSLW